MTLNSFHLILTNVRDLKQKHLPKTVFFIPLFFYTLHNSICKFSEIFFVDFENNFEGLLDQII